MENKILFITPKYNSNVDDPYLTNDLVSEISKKVDHIDVIGYSDINIRRNFGNIHEVLINISSNVKFIKYFFVWPQLIFSIIKLILTRRKYTKIIFFAPLTTMWPAAILQCFIRAESRVCIIFDIFPGHQCQIGSIPKRLEKFAFQFEKILLNRFDLYSAMEVNNKAAISEYYCIKKEKIFVLPLWISNFFDSAKKMKNTTDIYKFIFGGQLIKGRRFDLLIDFLNKLQSSGTNIHVDVYSKGEYFEQLKSQYTGFNWLVFKNQITREEYYKILPYYDVGLIVTDSNVVFPTFPSKILDYINVGLACLAVVEKTTDLAKISQEMDFIHLNHFDFSPEAIEKLKNFLSFINSVDDEVREQQYSSIRKYHSLYNASEILLK
jgi:glycosyltransferase involved in cell wall biosynthesis